MSADGGPGGEPGTGPVDPGPGADDDERVDEAEKESFPASDPPSSWAGADDPPAERPADPEPGDRR